MLSELEGEAMKDKQRILMYDDEKNFLDDLEAKVESVSEIKKEFIVKSLTTDDFQQVLDTCINRQKAFRTNAEWEGDATPLDDASIFIIDYDLLRAPVKQSLLTGEEFSYLVRCFSRCRLIIE